MWEESPAVVGAVEPSVGGTTERWRRDRQVFVAGQYDCDEFLSWQQRLSAYAGPAYRLIDTEDMRFDVRVGLGTRKEWGSENDNFELEAAIARTAGRLDHLLTKIQRETTASLLPMWQTPLRPPPSGLPVPHAILFRERMRRIQPL